MHCEHGWVWVCVIMGGWGWVVAYEFLFSSYQVGPLIASLLDPNELPIDTLRDEVPASTFIAICDNAPAPLHPHIGHQFLACPPPRTGGQADDSQVG